MQRAFSAVGGCLESVHFLQRSRLLVIGKMYLVQYNGLCLVQALVHVRIVSWILMVILDKENMRFLVERWQIQLLQHVIRCYIICFQGSMHIFLGWLLLFSC